MECSHSRCKDTRKGERADGVDVPAQCHWIALLEALLQCELREQGGHLTVFSDLVSEVVQQQHFCHVLLVMNELQPTLIQGEEN